MFTPAVRDIFNLIPADIGRPLSDITHRLQFQDLLQDAENVLEKLTVIEREVKTTGGRIHIMRVLPYRTAEDHINGVVVTFIDISEVLLERLEKTKDQENAELVKKLNNQVNRLNNLIVDLLDTTNIVEGHLTLKLQEFEINALIRDQVEEIKRLSKDHVFTINLDKPQHINADPERIAQVLTNLLSNAVKYSPPGSEITISTTVARNEIKVSVQDNGIGIPENMTHNVFNRFFRISNPQIQTYPGMGLGLYISAGIIERHGGIISVESTEGKGSTFYFTLQT
jgi:signal transduction histidine kinase